jgi:hypothetical protein
LFLTWPAFNGGLFFADFVAWIEEVFYPMCGAFCFAPSAHDNETGPVRKANLQTPDRRNCPGVTPFQRLNACMKLDISP